MPALTQHGRLDPRTVSFDRHRVPLEGLEPPTLSLGRNCSSIELQRRDASDTSDRTASHRLTLGEPGRAHR